MAKPCARCAAPGRSCGTAGVAAFKQPCVVCKVPTGVRTMCGAARTYMCDPVKPVAPAEASGPVLPSSGNRWLGKGAPRPVQGRAQPFLRDALHRVEPVLSAAEKDRAVELWARLMRGIEYRGGHSTALAILNGSFEHKAVPDMPPWDPAWLDPIGDDPVWSARIWTVPLGGVVPVGLCDMAGYDVNGMFLSAAASEHGYGAPTLLTEPAAAAYKLPGYVKVDLLDGAPWGIETRWCEGMWMPTPLVSSLHDAGADMVCTKALVWKQHRRWLDPQVNLLRAARAELAALDERAARVLLGLVKEIATRMFGGLLGSDEFNRGGKSYSPLAARMVEATGQARMFRGIEPIRTAKAGVHLAGVYVDALWFLLPAGFTDVPLLHLSSQLGKFKRAGRTSWSRDLAAAHRAGDVETLRKALK